MNALTMATRAGALGAALIGLLPGLAQAAAPANAGGVWLTEDGRARVQTETCGPARDRLCGYVVWLKTPLGETGAPRIDSVNPDPAKAGRPMLGHQLILGLKPNAEGRYEGQIYNSENGKKYDVTIWAESPSVLKVKGCLVAFLCATQTWNRTIDVLPGQLTGAANTATGPRADPEWASPVQAAGPVPQSASVRREPVKPKP